MRQAKNSMPTPYRRATPLPPVHPWTLLLVATVLVPACSGTSRRTGSGDLPADCNAFVATYESCLTAVNPSLPEVAKERGAQTREALTEEAKRATASSSGAAGLTALATKCHANLQRLTASCGQPQ
jgi:hypothetical protein